MQKNCFGIGIFNLGKVDKTYNILMNSDGDRPLWGMPIPHLHTDIINCKRKSIEIYALILMDMHIPKSGIGGLSSSLTSIPLPRHT